MKPITVNCAFNFSAEETKKYGINGTLGPLVTCLKRELISQLSLETLPESCALYLTIEELKQEE